MEEIWKDIKGYEGLYQVSNLGNIKSNNLYAHKKPKRIATYNHNAGYICTHLSKGGKTKTFLVHRLVAEAFLDNPKNLDFVNHKDENKKNNNVDNLEWCTKSYNSTYYLNKKPERKQICADRFINKETGKSYSSWTTHVPHKHFEKVVGIDEKGNVKEYENATLAAMEIGALVGNIISVCKWNSTHNKKRKSKGFIWEYKDKGSQTTSFFI